MSYTPAPWKMGKEKDGNDGWTGIYKEDDSGLNIIADAFTVADARLITAAPELLGALICDTALDILNAIPDDEESRKALIRYGYNPKGNFTPSEFVRGIRNAAINKAKGK